MALNINKIDYNTFYKTLDEREMYYATGITYVAKYEDSRKFSLSKKPVIFTYNFDLNGRINNIVYGELIKHKYQCGVEYSIMGWIIDKNTNFNELSDPKTAREITCSKRDLIPLSQAESELLNNEIYELFNDPIEYFKKSKCKVCK